jgi:alanyl-tRNA synthetase
MKDIQQIYQTICIKYNLPFEIIDKVNPYDDTTLFCPAGMQQYKEQFKDIFYRNTVANIQSCIRLNDFEELGDLTHLLNFRMIGLFSFREWTIEQAISFFLEFINELGLTISYVTIHPDKTQWLKYYPANIPIRLQEDCKWTDGDIGGYCTEFFIVKDGIDIEIGNIVNPLDNCIDVGFGYERLDNLVNNTVNLTKEEALQQAALSIISSGYLPSNKKQGYVLRKILRELANMNSSFDNDLYREEQKRLVKIKVKYESVKHKYSDKSKEWWWDTFGINIEEI